MLERLGLMTTKESAGLMPCKACGNDEKQIFFLIDFQYTIRCPKCGHDVGGKDYLKAKEEWNRIELEVDP